MREIDNMIDFVRGEILKRRPEDGSIWTGHLSSSAISTSVSVFALFMDDAKKHQEVIQRGVEWLTKTMLPDGSWGDTPESPANMTATLLTFAALSATGKAPEETKYFLQQRFKGTSDQHIISGVLKYYGKDLTFSAPILVMCALAGVISSWKEIPQLPFEVSVFPQKLFRFFRLPVVSYAIPALIAVGILRYKNGRKNIIRESFISKSLIVLEKLQPENGGFLEAAPLTGFVAMCMCGAGLKNHMATQRGIEFLVNTARKDGSWPIDTNLASWVTALSVRALGNDVINPEALANSIKSNAFKHKHPFTGAKEGGWGWTNLSGSVPDADDTAGALIALHALTKGEICATIEKGIEWLLNLQNSDGGMPTFCKGWGKLPFDRSSPDISAHSLLAFQLWMNDLNPELRSKCDKSMRRMLNWMLKEQASDGSWTPLWFGDQNAKDELAPVYGTAITIEYLSGIQNPLAQQMAAKGVAYLISIQNTDGGWGGAENVPSKITFTARALSALSCCKTIKEDILHQAFNFLFLKYQKGRLLQSEAIGLYFSRLWYSEDMYNITFVLTALKNYQTKIKQTITN
jgi:prenyltransferase beta subunit